MHRLIPPFLYAALLAPCSAPPPQTEDQKFESLASNYIENLLKSKQLVVAVFRAAGRQERHAHDQGHSKSNSPHQLTL